MKNYDYIATIDCESEFVRSFEPGEVMNDIWESQSFLTANKSSAKAQEITRRCAELIGLDAENSRVRQETESYLYYWWFNEIPVYRTDTLSGFFSWLDENSRRESIFGNWCCFDYLVYVMWLIECRGCGLRKIDVTSSFGITEGLYSLRGYEGFERKHNIHWTSRARVSDGDKNIVMRFHLDRIRNHRSILRKIKSAVRKILGLWRKN